MVVERPENTVHGSPWDRGQADSYYDRPRDPHWWPEGTGRGKRVERYDMNAEEIIEYNQGYTYNEHYGDKKDWGDF
jgi:hypothetical protein